MKFYVHSYALFCAAVAMSTTFGCFANIESFDGEAAATDEAELGALSNASIVGDIPYSDNFVTVNYTKNPRYRALRFQGKQGDLVKVRINANTPGRSSTAWLLGSNFRTIQQVTGDVVTYFEATLDKTGTYYVALRETGMRDAEFAVQLRAVDNSISDPFDPASCAGEPLGSNEMRALVGTADERSLGKFEIQYRERTCSVKGCGDWRPGVSPERSNCSGRRGNYTFPGCNLPGELKLGYGAAGFSVGLGYRARYYTSSVVDDHIGSHCIFDPSGEVACNEYGFVYHVDTSDFCNLHVCKGESYNHAFLELGDYRDGRPAEARRPKLRGALKNGCFQVSATIGGLLGQTEWVETQAAVLVRF